MIDKYFVLTNKDRREMLKYLEIPSLENLLTSIPENIRLKKALHLKTFLDEEEILEHLKDLANKNELPLKQKNYVPTVVDYIINGSPELVTSYTPYQAEISQGALTILYNFQSYIANLTGCDLANASMYDGASATAEAILMALRATKKKKEPEVILSNKIPPEYQAVIRTYLSGLGVTLHFLDPDIIPKHCNSNTACVVLSQINSLGNLEDIEKIASVIHQNQGLLIVESDPLFLSLLETPGKLGADIVVGEISHVGNYPYFGGPGCGFLATQNKFHREIPGRLVGKTSTVGKTSYVLITQTREQHIRREKATSNICTSQVLMAIRSTICLAYLGEKGLIELAKKNLTSSISERFLTANKKNLLPQYRRKPKINLPEMSELETRRYFFALTRKAYGVDTGSYFLGSCTMKLTPAIAETVANLDGFRYLLPEQKIKETQGSLELMYNLEKMLSKITGMDRFTLQPAAGAQGEFAGLLMIKAFHEKNGENQRKNVIIPDSAHGTNPASATLAGLKSVTVKSNKHGMLDLEDLKKLIDEKTAALMLTVPNTLGIFEKDILEITKTAHEAGALVYMDGANMNALLGLTRPGDFGIDVLHLNLHKTFGAPHGAGGPGSGPVGVNEKLVPFLPVPTVEINKAHKFSKIKFYFNYRRPLSIGKLQAHYGSFAIAIKAYAYILGLGGKGLRQVAKDAILAASYLKKKLLEIDGLEVPYPEHTLHEFVASLSSLKKETGLTAKDVCKRLLDFGVHPPTMYFPLIVKEALMIEPTETVSKKELDEFADALEQIIYECHAFPNFVKNAPHTLPVPRIDETRATREFQVREL